MNRGLRSYCGNAKNTKKTNRKRKEEKKPTRLRGLVLFEQL